MFICLAVQLIHLYQYHLKQVNIALYYDTVVAKTSITKRTITDKGTTCQSQHPI